MYVRYSVVLFILAVLSAGLLVADAQAQQRGVVQGRIVDASDGSPLPGANVIVEGTTIGASTNQNGRYQLTGVPAGSQTLVASFVSYERESASITVQAGATVTQNFELQSRVLEGGEVVVTGIRRSQSRAISQKRQALNVVDVLSADDIGNLPEKNVAEAVQRLPGIVMRSDRTEGRFVSIRGSAANLNNVTLNGNTLASTAGSRATALDLLPAEMVSNIEVTKAVTPDMPANAIGGSININTLSAFDRSRAFAFGSFRGLSHDQQVDGLRDSKTPYRANVTAGTQFGANNQFGLVVSGSGSRRDFTSSGLKGEGWDDAVDRTFNGIAIPFAQEQIVESHLRRRFAFNTSFDWQPTDQTSVYVRPYYTYTNEEVLDNELEYNLLGDATPTRSGARFAEGFGSIDLSKTDQDESLWGGSLGFEQQFSGAVTWSASGTFTRGILDETLLHDVTPITHREREGLDSVILDVRDLSADDLRIDLVLKKDADEQKVLAYLHRHTSLQANFSINLTCLVPTENPDVAAPVDRTDLKTILWHFLHFRLDVVTRRLQHELETLERRIHVLEGFAVAFDALDEIIKIIRASDGKADAAQKILKRFGVEAMGDGGLDADQVDAILELKLYRLARLEIEVIRKELDEKNKRAREIRKLLDEDADEMRSTGRWGIVREEIEQALTLGPALNRAFDDLPVPDGAVERSIRSQVHASTGFSQVGHMRPWSVE